MDDKKDCLVQALIEEEDMVIIRADACLEQFTKKPNMSEYIRKLIKKRIASFSPADFRNLDKYKTK